MFSAEESWKMTEPEKVLAIIKEAGVWRLSNCDGCMCGGFELRNVRIDISCGKGRDRGIWISSRSLDYWKEGTEDDNVEDLLRPIAEEVARQVEKSDGRGPLAIHCCEWKKWNDKRSPNG